jgi:hypothetical protein
MAVLLALALLAGGLHGVVMRGPTKPVCEMGSACSAPAPGVTLVFSRGSALAARVRSDRRGRYAVRLAPGTYEVATAPPPVAAAWRCSSAR